MPRQWWQCLGADSLRCCVAPLVGLLGLDTRMTPAAGLSASGAGSDAGSEQSGMRRRFADVWDEPATLSLLRVGADATPPLLDPEQQVVVSHRGAPLLVLAGPGTGKTTTLVEAMLARICGDDALECAQVLGLTFGRAAAEQWRERVAVRLGAQPPTVTTFHSCAFALLRRFPEIVHLAGPPRLLAGYEEQTVVREVISAALELGKIEFPENLRIAALTAEFGRQLRAVMARARGAGISARRLKDEAIAAGDRSWQLAADLFATYERFLEDSDSFDYASLIVTATAIAQDPHVRGELHRSYRAVFVDEYQDTDPAQVEFLKALVGPECDLVAVGDPDQSIYAFRGADVRGILNFVDDFSEPGRPAQVAVLRTCRRFSPDIRTIADIGLNRVNYAGTSWWATVREAHRSPLCVGAAPTEPAVSVTLCADPRVEAAQIVEDIRRLRQQGESFSSMAVLVRNAEQITPILRECAAAGVPAVAAGDAQPVATNAAVIALMDALIVAESPHSATPAIAEFNKTTGHNLTYTSTGSGTGKRNFKAGTFKFAGTDSAVTGSDIPTFGWTYVPYLAGATAIAYRLDEIKGATLSLSKDTLNGIFAGLITNWNDPNIAADMKISPAFANQKKKSDLKGASTLWENVGNKQARVTVTLLPATVKSSKGKTIEVI
ncbi:MAG: hypothetical protein EB027_05145, partial [Actinobacteria bacterium]|nr:hypothetical protein [Actinomycetota bacterium]